jgi:hypothetical protein
MTTTPLRICNYVILSTPVFFIAGIVMMLLARGQGRILQIGTGISLLGVACFFLGLGSRSLSVIILGAKVAGGKVVKERPVYSAAWTLFSLALTALGVGLFYFVVARFFL